MARGIAARGHVLAGGFPAPSLIPFTDLGDDEPSRFLDRKVLASALSFMN